MPAHESAQYSPNPTLEPGAPVGYFIVELCQIPWWLTDELGTTRLAATRLAATRLGTTQHVRHVWHDWHVWLCTPMRRLNWHDMTVWTRRLLRQIVQLILTKSGTFTFKWLFLGCIEADPSDRRLSLTCLSCSTWVSRWDSRLYNLTKRMKLRTLESWCIWASTRPLVRRFVRWALQKYFDTQSQKKC